MRPIPTYALLVTVAIVLCVLNWTGVTSLPWLVVTMPAWLPPPVFSIYVFIVVTLEYRAERKAALGRQARRSR